jgi:hypothetical protein
MLDAPGHTKLVIDVSIEESQDDHEESQEPGTSSIISAAGGGPHTSVRMPAPVPSPTQNKWGKMKGFAQKLRRNRSQSESVTVKDRVPERRIR